MTRPAGYPTTQPLARASDPAWTVGADRGVLRLLRTHPPSPVHIIDPFKVPIDEAVQKAAAVAERGLPALILASTDYHDFERWMPGYVARVKAAARIPVLLHFPPRRGIGFPVVGGADGIIMPALLGSEDDYFVWQSHLETLVTLPGRVERQQWPEILLTAALTFGADAYTYDVLGTIPQATGVNQLTRCVEVVRRFGFHLVYLYSRNEHVPAEVCRFFRRHLRPEQVLFVSGRVRTPEQIDTYIRAGADYVGFAGALEDDDWRASLDRMLTPLTAATEAPRPSAAGGPAARQRSR